MIICTIVNPRYFLIFGMVPRRSVLQFYAIMSGRCLAGVWPLSGRCLAGVWSIVTELVVSFLRGSPIRQLKFCAFLSSSFTIIYLLSTFYYLDLLISYLPIIVSSSSRFMLSLAFCSHERLSSVYQTYRR